MVTVLGNSKVSTFPNSEYPNNLYTGYLIESVDKNNSVLKGKVYDINESSSDGHFVINDEMMLDEKSIVYKVNFKKNEFVNNHFLSFDLRNQLDDISIECIKISDIKKGDFICNSFFFIAFCNDREELLRKGIDESDWKNFVDINKLENESYEIKSPILIEKIKYNKIKQNAFDISCVIENETNLISTDLVKNVKSIFIDSIMIEYNYD